MPDCEHPKCHEHMTTELSNKATWKRLDEVQKDTETRVPKKWLWLALVFIGIPLFITSVGVWSNQRADYLRYASKDEVRACQVRIEKLEQSSKFMIEDLNEIKSDVKQMLQIVRGIQDGRQ